MIMQISNESFEKSSVHLLIRDSDPERLGGIGVSITMSSETFAYLVTGLAELEVRYKINDARWLSGLMVISRNSRDEVMVNLKDMSSRLQFFNGKVTLSNFGAFLSNYSVDIDVEYSGLEHLGKKKVIEHKQVHCPLESYDRGLVEWFEKNVHDQSGQVFFGKVWNLKDSIRNKESGGCVLSYTVHRFVEEKNDDL